MMKLMAMIGMKSNSESSELMNQNDYEFLHFVSKYGKQYPTRQEFNLRSVQFKHTLNIINEHNAQPDITSTQGINQFSDWTAEEWNKMLGSKVESRDDPNPKCSDPDLELEARDIPESIDWNKKGAVTPIKW